MITKRSAYLGSDSVTYAENSSGRIFLTSAASPLPPGFIRKVAETVPDVERVWAKLDAQEKHAYAQMTERDYQQRRGRIEQMRDFCQRRLQSSDCKQQERDAIRYALGFCDRKEDLLNRNTVYGVAEMQLRDAPLPARVNTVIKVVN